MKWTVLILAGSRGPLDPVAQAAGVGHKAFAAINGRPMITYVVDTLRAEPRIERIAASIEKNAPDLPDGVERIDADDSPASSLRAAMTKLPTPLLVTTADHPLLLPEMVSSFLDEAENSPAAALTALCPREIAEQAGNPARRTYLPFRDGRASGTNLFALKTPQTVTVVEFWRRLERLRKSPLRMAMTLGPSLLLRTALGRLKRADAEKALERATGCPVAFAELLHPDAAHDVDSANDLKFVARRLIERQKIAAPIPE